MLLLPLAMNAVASALSGPAPLNHDPPYWTGGSVAVDWTYAPDVGPLDIAAVRLEYRDKDSSNSSMNPAKFYSQVNVPTCAGNPCSGSFTFDFAAQGRVAFFVVAVDSSNVTIAAQPAYHPSGAGYDNMDPLPTVTNPGAFWKTSSSYSIGYSGADNFASDVLKELAVYRSACTGNGTGCGAETEIVHLYWPANPTGTTTSNSVPGPGYYRYRTFVLDEAGRSASQTAVLGVDLADPSASFTKTGAYWRSLASVDLSFSASDPVSGFDRAELWKQTTDNNLSYTSLAFVRSYVSSSSSFTEALAADKGTRFELRVYDNAGRMAPRVVDVASDQGRPTAQIVTGAYWNVNRTLTFSYVTSDNTWDDALRNVTLWEEHAPTNSSGAFTNRTKVVDSSAPADFDKLVARAVSEDGWYRYTLHVYDKAGWSIASPARVIRGVDTGFPSASAGSASRFWVAPAGATVAYQGADALEMGDLMLERSSSPDNSTFGQYAEVARVTAGPWSSSYAFSSPPEGWYRFRARSVDAAGHSTLSGVQSLGVDLGPPTSNLSAGGYWQRADVNLTLSATDSMNLSLYRVLVSRGADNSTWGPETVVASGGLSGKSSALPLVIAPGTQGFHRFRAQVWDESGKSANSTVFVGVDGAAPSASAANAGSYWTGSPVALSYGAHDPIRLARLDVLWRNSTDNTSWGSWTVLRSVTSAPFNSSMNVSLPLEGHYEFAAVGTDAAGNSGPVATQARAGLDLRPPTAAGSVARYWHAGAIPVGYAANDTLGLSSVIVRARHGADNSSWGPWALVTWQNLSGKSASGNASYAPPQPGHYEFEIAAADRSMKRDVVVVEAGYDAEPPRTSLSGLGNYTGSSSFGIAATESDSWSGVRWIELWHRKDGGSWTKYAEFTGAKVSFDTSKTGGDGRYEFRAIGVDRAGNVEAKSAPDIATTVDTRPPTTTMRMPTPGASYVPHNVTVAIAFDEAVRPDAKVAWDDGARDVKFATNWSADGRELRLEPKERLAPLTRYHVDVWNYSDLAGNGGTPGEWEFSTAPIPPRVVTTDPLPGARVPAGEVTVKVTFSAPMIDDARKAATVKGGALVAANLDKSALALLVSAPVAGPLEIRILSAMARDATTGMDLDGNGDGDGGDDFVLLLEVVPRAGSLAGKVSAEGGGALEGVGVRLEQNGTLVAANITDGAGDFRIAGLKPGSYRLAASKAGYAPYHRDVVIEAGKEARVEIALAPRAGVIAMVPGGIAGLIGILALVVLILVVVFVVVRRRRRSEKMPVASRPNDEEKDSWEARLPREDAADDAPPGVVERGATERPKHPEPAKFIPIIREEQVPEAEVAPPVVVEKKEAKGRERLDACPICEAPVKRDDTVCEKCGGYL